jgi:hypothetical protein
MLSIARRCVPFTPFDKDLSTATVAPSAMASGAEQGVSDRRSSDIQLSPIGVQRRRGRADRPSHCDHWKRIPIRTSSFRSTLRELKDGVIAAVNDKHYCYGYDTTSRAVRDDVSELADKIERSKSSSSLLTAAVPRRAIGRSPISRARSKRAACRR